MKLFKRNKNLGVSLLTLRMWHFTGSAILNLLIFTLLACLLSTSGGILVSLHSATARQAQQNLLLSAVALSLAIYFGINAIPQQVLLAMNATQISLIVMLFLAVIDAILLAISIASFHRSRLISN